VVDLKGLPLSSQFSYRFVQVIGVLEVRELSIEAVKFLTIRCKQRSAIVFSA
jgi:hypothetical protein